MKLVVLCLCAAAAAGQTFNKDIAPIVYRHCVACHRPGEAAPFSLLDYASAKQHARQIAAVTESRFMPPWKPEPGKGEFAGEHRLTTAQIKLIRDWVASGAPEGAASDLPPQPVFPDGWQLGKPDLVVTLQKPFELPAAGSDVFRNFVLPVPLNRTRYVRAVEIRPGNKKVVHHANLLVDRERNSRARDGQDGAPGFPGMDTRIETRAFDPESHFLFWKPGTPVTEEAPGMAWRLEPGADLVLNMHLQPGGKPEIVQPAVGLYFTDQPPTRRPMLVQLENDGALDIPPGDRNFVVTDKLVLPVDVDVLGIYPHAHYTGKDMEAMATLPDGTRRWLIHIADWDINWQAVYRYKQPLFLPKGSVISMRFTYDNSAANPRNPNHPPARVAGGDRSVDEMSHLWLQVLPRPAASGGDPRLPLQEAVLRRRLEKYPRDFFAHFSLGSVLQTRGDIDGAIAEYRTALAVSPKDATAHNALGTALQDAGQVEGAITEFQAALHQQPDHADAHYNLARLFLAANRPAEGIAHLREVVRIDPGDAAALSDLGAALQMTGQAAEGLRYLRDAVRAQPEFFNGRYNLGQALAAAGRRDEAEAQFREALRLKPGDEDTLAALRSLRGGPER